MTQGVAMALQDLGICWPEQVDIAGFGAFKPARLYRPPLTLIKQPTSEMGKRAVTMLIEQITGVVNGQPRAVVLQNQLVFRDDWLKQRGILVQNSVVD
jgi:DNA-binding LacI/PurR family transcriptional regulator